MLQAARLAVLKACDCGTAEPVARRASPDASSCPVQPDRWKQGAEFFSVRHAQSG